MIHSRKTNCKFDKYSFIEMSSLNPTVHNRYMKYLCIQYYLCAKKIISKIFTYVICLLLLYEVKLCDLHLYSGNFFWNIVEPTVFLDCFIKKIYEAFVNLLISKIFFYNFLFSRYIPEWIFLYSIQQISEIWI